MTAIKKIIKMQESKTLEFKRDLSSHEKIVRTIIAFANAAGGKIIIGIDDDRKIVGVDDPLDMEERLTNIIFDCIAPKILPSIEIVPIEDKQLLLVEVFPCGNMPYYHRKLGRENGVFVRLGSSTRTADQDLVNELSRLSNGIAFDGLPCFNATIDDLDIDYIRKLFPDRDNRDEQMLKTLRIVNYEQNKIVPTNGGIILFAKERTRFFDDLFVQCARFRGKTKGEFIDHIEIYEKPFEAIKQIEIFLKKHALRGFALDGMKRVDKWNIPFEALREIIVNAIVHADYSVKGVPMRIAIYDDRIEIENPGYFLPGLTFEEILSGTSKVRNPMIMRIFKELELVEQWGSGIPRIFEEITEFGLSMPKMEEVAGRVRATVEVHIVGINAKKHTTSSENNIETPMKSGMKSGMKSTANQVFDLICNDNSMSISDISAVLNITRSTIQKHIETLKTKGVIERIGAGKGGYWKIIK